MKTTIVLSGIVVFLLFSACTHNYSKEKPIKIEVYLKGELPPSVLKGCDGTLCSIEIDLTNKSDTTIYFWEMSCSWQDNWRFNTDSVFLYSAGCDHNTPILRKLNPGQKIKYIGILCSTLKHKALNINHIQLGFVLIKENEFNIEKDSFHTILTAKSKERNRFLWCAPFKMGN